MRLAHHVTLNFNNNMPTAAVLVNIEKAFDTAWHSGLIHKLSEFEFSTSLMKLIASFKVLGEDEFSKPRKIAVGVPQIEQSLYI
jgi:hypothetical protein